MLEKAVYATTVPLDPFSNFLNSIALSSARWRSEFDVAWQAAKEPLTINDKAVCLDKLDRAIFPFSTKTKSSKKCLLRWKPAVVCTLCYAEHSQQLLLRYLHLISSHCTVFLVGKTPLLQSSTVLSFITAAATTSKNRSCSKQLLQPLPVPRVVLGRSRHTQPTEICNGRAIIGKTHKSIAEQHQHPFCIRS